MVDYTDDPNNPYAPPPVHPGANTGSGPWAPGYDPGPNWNGGVAPTTGGGRYDYNNGSAPNSPNEPLSPGNSWAWQGPQTPRWDMTTSQWDRGVWNQVAGTAPPPPQATGTGTITPTQDPGAVAPISSGGGSTSGINVPGSTLPPDIQGLFNQQPTKTPIQSAYQDALLKYMNRGFETPTLNDSILGPQSEVFRASNQRNTERQRLTAVERAGTGQGGSGYLDNMINEGVQKQGFNNAQFDANLLGGEMNKRREELQAALQMASATGNQEATRDLQMRLTQIQTAMAQQGLNLQGQLGFGDLDLRRDALGANTALSMEGLNQRALQMIMGGG